MAQSAKDLMRTLLQTNNPGQAATSNTGAVLVKANPSEASPTSLPSWIPAAVLAASVVAVLLVVARARADDPEELLLNARSGDRA